MRAFKRILLSLLAAVTVYAALLTYPQPLFAHELEHAGIVVHATSPIPDAMRGTLERVRARVNRSELFVPSAREEVFICTKSWVFALFARQNRAAGGIANGFLGQHVFLRDSDMHRDRLFSPSGSPVAADRPLSYFIAHELTHIAQVRAIGKIAYARVPRWVDDGYADYVARNIDLAATLASFKAGDRELDPARSGLYLRYHLMVAYVLGHKGMTIRQLLTTPPDGDAILAELQQLPLW